MTDQEMRLVATTMEQILENAAKVVTRVYDPELHDMIHRFDNTPAPELKLDVNDHMKLYNWLKELELYRKLCGPLNKVWEDAK